MALKSRGKNLSFDILRLIGDQNDVVLINRVVSDPLTLKNEGFDCDWGLLGEKRKRRRKKKGSRRKLVEIGNLGFEERGEIGNLGGFEVEERGKNGNLGSFDEEERGNVANLGGFEGEAKGRIVNLGGLEGETKGRIVNFGCFEGEAKGRGVNFGGFEGEEGGKIVNLDGCEVGERGKIVNLDGFEVGESGRMVNLDGFEVGFYDRKTVRVVEGREDWSSGNGVGQFGGELRQRNVGLGNEEVSSSGMGVVVEENEKEEFRRNEEDRGARESNGSIEKRESVNGKGLERLDIEVALDWKKVMANEHHLMENFSIETSPIKHFMEDLQTGHSLKSTVTLGNEKDRERVYDTIFRLPWRCELLIDVGFFVCLDSFLSALTIMPVRMAMTLWKSLKTRQFLKPSAEELSDFGCLLVLASGVTILQQIDISLIYHMIRGQGTIKLYVVYNVLEIFDKLFQSFVGDVMQTMFQSADELANCPSEHTKNALLRFVSDEVLAIVSSIFHSFILLVQAITLSTCIVAHNNALFALLLSNNFSEIKSNVFKRFSKDNVHSIAYSDSVERFHICAFLLFVLAQNLLEAEGPWFNNFLHDALLVYLCEVLIDIIKHSFIAKFNDIKPIAFSEFLEDLSKQTLNKLTEPEKRRLIFVPLAPACAVLRVLRPVYAAHLPYNPLPWRLLCMFVLSALTFIMLGVLKIMVSKGLKQHASWYVKRCETRKSHTD